MALDLSSLQKAVEALDKAINSYLTNQNNESLTDADKETLKSGVIQNFEVAYEMCIKFIRRWIEANIGGSNPDSVTFKELLRIAAESQLVQDVDNWVEYRQARNDTSHTYDNDKADDVFKVSLNFVKDGKQLLLTLEKKND